MASLSVTKLALALIALGIAYLWRLNKVMSQTPPEAIEASPFRWADSEIKTTYDRIKKNPIDWSKTLPPKLNRRYLVTGGSGGVGGQLVLHLLQRGEAPESIRIVDFRRVERTDMKSGSVTKVDFAQADITSPEATVAAFDKPWPPSVAKLPLTVFHVAAMIVPHERTMATYGRIKRVNIDGTKNVMAAAKAAGADIFIATASASIGYRPAGYWGNPLRRWPRNYFQFIDESDFEEPLAPRSQYFANYAHTKAIAERMICQANSDSFRTGTIRPANGIYGSSEGDQVVGLVLRSQGTQSWMPNIMQNFVSSGHISLGHLLFEAALLREKMPKCAGRPFVITDDGAPPQFGDVYRLCEVAAETPIKVTYLPPGMFFVISHIVEWFVAASRIPGLKFLQPKGDIALLQPGVFHASLNYLATDAAAQRSVEDGGIGLKHAHNTLEGMCQQLVEWNAEHGSSKA